MIAAIWALMIKPAVKQLFYSTIGRWFGLILVNGLSAAAGATVALILAGHH
ncbi:hypothetical protein [Streptomyces noursei]|uniref:hypothetical protein n=1 Tax=Streptomyces noursei TaxID=1971 RepID=UPI0038047E36